MIYVYGDSHAIFNFKGYGDDYLINKGEKAITMYRIGRDNKIINFEPSHLNKDNIYVFIYGEIDCRCHIGKQIKLGRDIQTIVKELIFNYERTILNNITTFKAVIICAVIPPVIQAHHELLHGPITHEFPFVGTDRERLEYTICMNTFLKELCSRNGWLFFNPYNDYTTEDGFLKFDLSDTYCHISKNRILLQLFDELIDTIECTSIGV